MQVTIDDPNEEIHDYTRGSGTYKKILSNINRLLKLGYCGSLNIRMNLHKKNYMFIDDMFELLPKIRASFINFALINPVGGGKNFMDTINIKDDFILSKIQATVEKKSKQHSNINVLFEGLKESIDCPYYGKENIQSGLRISPAGEVFPCQLFTDDIFSLDAILLIAPTHQGKTTIGTALTLNGYVYLSDDVAIFRTDGKLVPFPLPIKLRKTKLLCKSELSEKYHIISTENYDFLIPHQNVSECFFPQKVVFLKRHNDDKCSIDVVKLDKFMALQRLIINASYCRDLLTHALSSKRIIQNCSTILEITYHSGMDVLKFI